jgi:hypothetical protein
MQPVRQQAKQRRPVERRPERGPDQQQAEDRQPAQQAVDEGIDGERSADQWPSVGQPGEWPIPDVGRQGVEQHPDEREERAEPQQPAPAVRGGVSPGGPDAEHSQRRRQEDKRVSPDQRRHRRRGGPEEPGAGVDRPRDHASASGLHDGADAEVVWVADPGPSRPRRPSTSAPQPIATRMAAAAT